MNTNAFAIRHIGPSHEDQKEMLKTIGVESLDQLINETIPDGIRLKNGLNLDEPMSENEYLIHSHSLSKLNKVFKTYIGLGYHPTIIPAVIQRNILENPGWYTSYTPYQPEMSQGTLQAIFEYQTLTARLLGMEVANASQYDGASALAEAALMAVRISSRKKVAVSRLVHPCFAV